MAAVVVSAGCERPRADGSRLPCALLLQLGSRIVSLGGRWLRPNKFWIVPFDPPTRVRIATYGAVKLAKAIFLAPVWKRIIQFDACSVVSDLVHHYPVVALFCRVSRFQVAGVRVNS